MKVHGIVGWKNAGKTTLMEALVRRVRARGFTVSTIKHVHHGVDLDRPGTDSFRHRSAGAGEVMLASPARFALLHEYPPGADEPPLAALLSRLAPVDLVLVEGFKTGTHPRIEVWRKAADRGDGRRPLLCRGDPGIRAVATDGTIAGLKIPVLDLNDPDAIAEFILRDTGLAG